MDDFQMTKFKCDYVIQTSEYKPWQVISIGQKIRDEGESAKKTGDTFDSM